MIENAYGQDIRPQGNRAMKRKSSTRSTSSQSPSKKARGNQTGDGQHWSVNYKYDGGQYAPWEIDSETPPPSSPPAVAIRPSPSPPSFAPSPGLPDFEYPVSPPSLVFDDVTQQDVDISLTALPSPVSTSTLSFDTHTNQTQTKPSNFTLPSSSRIPPASLESPACSSSASEISDYLLYDELSPIPPLLSLTLSDLLHPSLYSDLQAFVQRLVRVYFYFWCFVDCPRFGREFDHDRVGLATAYTPQATLKCQYQAGGILSSIFFRCPDKSRTKRRIDFTTNMIASGRTEISDRLTSMGSHYFCTRTRAEGVGHEFLSTKISAGSPGTVEVMTRSTFEHEHTSASLTLEQAFTLGVTIPLSGKDDVDTRYASRFVNEIHVVLTSSWSNRLGSRPFAIISHLVTIRDTVFRSEKSFFEEYPWMASD